jgi:hypothetical protein
VTCRKCGNKNKQNEGKYKREQTVRTSRGRGTNLVGDHFK